MSEFCASCYKWPKCRKICLPVENFLEEGTQSKSVRSVTYPLDSLDHFTHKAQENGLLARADDAPETDEGQPQEKNEQLHKICEGIETLTKKQRQTLDLWLPNATHAQMADQLEVSRQNVTKILGAIVQKVAKVATR